MRTFEGMGRSLLVLASVIGLFSCGSGLDPEEAQATCDREREADSVCVNDAAYQSCLTCYEDCGVDCLRGESCPLTYSCE